MMMAGMLTKYTLLVLAVLSIVEVILLYGRSLSGVLFTVHVKTANHSTTHHNYGVNDLPMCEPNVTARREQNKLTLRSDENTHDRLLRCIFLDCSPRLHDTCNDDCVRSGLTSTLCVKTTVQKCSEFTPVRLLNGSTVCHHQLAEDHQRIVTTASSNIFIGVKSSSYSYPTRLPVSLLTWMQALYHPQQVSLEPSSL